MRPAASVRWSGRSSLSLPLPRAEPLLRPRPNCAQQAPEISAEDQADVGVAVTAPDQLLGQVVNLLRMVEAVGVDPAAEGVARVVAGLELLVLVGRHVVIAVEVGVRADADMLDADEPGDMVDMVDDVADIGRLAA